MAITDQPARRALKFDQLDEVVADVHRLQANGYRSLGKWDLAQTCNHIADWMTFPVTGFPKPPLPMRVFLWVLKHAMGKRILKIILTEGSMRTGSPTMPATVYPAGQDVGAAMQKLEQAVERFQNHQGAYHPSPVFGPMERDTCSRLQRIHCAHHLSFLIPS